jgi:hypothetical protein
MTVKPDCERPNFINLNHFAWQAMAIDEPTVKRAAIDDPDLKPLWDSMSGTIWKRTA